MWRSEPPECAAPASRVCPDLSELIPGLAGGMPPCIVAAVDTAGAGGASAIAADLEPVCGALAADASEDDVLTSGGVAAENSWAVAEFWRKKKNKAIEFTAKKVGPAEISRSFSMFFNCFDMHEERYSLVQ